MIVAEEELITVSMGIDSVEQRGDNSVSQRDSLRCEEYIYNYKFTICLSREISLWWYI